MNIIFDLDGTLIDSSASIEHTFLEVAAGLNIPLPPGYDVKRTIGNPLYDTFYALTGHAQQSETALRQFRHLYKAKFIYGYHLYPQAFEFIQQAVKAGHRLFVVTNKARLLAEMILAHAGLAHCFAGIYGPELHASGNKKELVRQLLEQHPSINHHNSLFVGDTVNDAEAARLAGLDTVILLHGYGHRHDFIDFDIACFCSGFHELQLYFSQQRHAAL